MPIIHVDINIKKATHYLFLAVAGFSILGNIIDLLEYYGKQNFILYLNGSTITIVGIALAIYLGNEKNLKWAAPIVIYTVILNSLTSLLVTGHAPNDFVFFFLRESIFIILILTVGAFIAGKYHSFVICGLYAMFSIYSTTHLNHYFLNNNISLILIIWCGYSYFIFLFVNLLENSIVQLNEQNKTIKKQNNELQEVTVRLEEINERLHEKNEELEHTNRIKDKFFSIVAHDLKNPAHSITGYTGLLRNKYDSYDSLKLGKFLEMLDLAANQLTRLLENLLTWSRTQTDRITLYPKVFDAGQSSESVLAMLLNSAQKKNLRLINLIEPNTEIYADPMVFDTVLRNLVANSLKFTDEDGSITVSKEIKNNLVYFKVKDTGVGMSPDHVEKLFSVDSSVSKKGTHQESGTGLGLLICKELTALSGGDIRVESKEGEGSSFIFSLPLAHV